MAFMSPVDSMFLLMESREHPMHVGGLSLFTPPEGSDGAGLARSMYEDLSDTDNMRQLFLRKPQHLLTSFAPLRWTHDATVDADYHLRLSALPSPGRVRELLELVSRLHGTLLDRHRPLWELHVIEGLNDGRVAVYFKTHHALIDGVAATRAWYRALSEDATTPFVSPWVEPEDRKQAERADKPSSGGSSPLSAALGGVARAALDVAGIAPATIGSALQAFNDNTAALPFQAPRTIFNVPITGARRFAAQAWPMERLRAVSDAAGVTVNDTVLAMSAGALRRYLLELGALPDEPLVAMVPVSLRKEGDGEGNAVGAVLCNLGTELTDAGQRLHRVHQSMRYSKNVLAGLSPLQSLAVSALNIGGLALGPLGGADRLTGPPFNIIISNVPGPDTERFWNGARLENFFPASIPVDGQALNITVASYADTMQFGLTGCRRNVPRLQRLLVHLEDSLAELEKATA
ncbi:wax ester/triacylglycerol synthase family O-acyltransferase [Rhodococcus sp. X156]|uniref:WS/DGAT/MGAT family O-acyltransferase n=1 Tax=Rhodococcus sp. X156 TaxID=2499145 RepID=UPI000FDCC6CB|nr:wax ester/triacylglycerol synthase family O-acyltransferase [Rhodococcus sp. X156]